MDMPTRRSALRPDGRSRGRAFLTRMVFSFMRSRFLPFRILFAILAISLMFSLALAAPVKRGSASRHASSARKAGKASARHANASHRGGRSSRVSVRAGRGRHGRGVIARGRGRYRGSRWTKRNVSALGGGGHSAGVHNFLSQEWSREQAAPLAPPQTATLSATPSMTAAGPEARQPLAMANTVPVPAPDAARHVRLRLDRLAPSSSAHF